MIEQNIDANKVDEYLAKIAEFQKRYEDKKSEMRWADDEWEESAIRDEMDRFYEKITLLSKKLDELQVVRSEVR